MAKPTIDRGAGELTVELGAFLPEFEQIAEDGGYDDPAELLRQHAIKLVSNARFDAAIKERVIVTGDEADRFGAQTLQDAAKRHGVRIIVAGKSGHHEGKIFLPSGGWAYADGRDA